MAEWTIDRENEIRERCEKATPGPWNAVKSNPGALIEAGGYANGRRIFTVLRWYLDATRCDETTDFIAQARQDLPDALAEISRLRTELRNRDYSAEHDSRRLDFLEGCSTVRLDRIRESECGGSYIDYLLGSKAGESKRLRQAIDAAMGVK